MKLLSEIYNVHRDGETCEYYHPIVSYVQGSLAEERRTSSGRFGKDSKEFQLVQRLNRKYRLSLYEVLRTTSLEKDSKEITSYRPSLLEDRLSHLGASYPELPGLGVYIRGLKNLEGKGQGKKIFDLLFYISSLPDLSSYWKYILLSPIGKLVLNLNIQSKWIQNSTGLFVMLGINSLANEYGREILQNKSAVADSLKRGEILAKSLSIEFYSNTAMYRSKVRRRGYARSSPVRPGSSKKEVREANTSIEYLTESGYLKPSTEGGYDLMESKVNVEEIIFNTFKKSLEAFEIYQKEILEKKKTSGEIHEHSSPKEDVD